MPWRWQGLIAGGILCAGSMIFIVGGWQLGLGSPFRLGTGAFPFITGFILMILSLAIAVQDVRSEPAQEAADWISLTAIGAALAVFAGTADRLGLVPAVFLTILVASAPDRNLPIGGKVALGAAISLAAWAIFIQALNLPLNAFAGG
ncbi:MAG: tripartite tricarboxylate transporter TctB family protein [Paracoccaceae bacterium]|nr:tripartite tricarboxylate transporter TctB family protein [Paracoccaceae bacterium]